MLDFMRKYSKWATIFILGAALIAVYKTFDSFHFFVSVFSVVLKAAQPFIIAFIIAYLLNIPVKRVDNLIKKNVKLKSCQDHSYVISIAAVYVLFLVIVILVISSLLPALFKSLLDMVQNLPMYVTQLFSFINNMEVCKKIGIHFNVMDIDSSFRNWLRTIDTSTIGQYAQGGFISVTAGIKSAASTAINVFIAFIASVYMLIDKERIIRGTKRVIRAISKDNKVESVLEHLTSINRIFTQYIYSRLICCVIMAVVCTVILAVLGEKYALLLGIFIGLMDMIPYFGSIISWVVSAIVTVISGGVLHAVWCSIATLVMQQIDGNVIAPRVMGNRLEIRPLTIIVAVSVGGSLFGFIGMLISVPVVAVIRVAFIEYIKSREKKACAAATESNSSEVK